VPMGTQPAGLSGFHWDGLTDNGAAAAPGVYVISASALLNGQTQAVNTLVADKVNSVNIGANGSGLTLNLSGLGSVDFSTVREIM
jgi:flagellar basal-body rod modification protein FlgD